MPLGVGGLLQKERDSVPPPPPGRPKQSRVATPGREAGQRLTLFLISRAVNANGGSSHVHLGVNRHKADKRGKGT